MPIGNTPHMHNDFMIIPNKYVWVWQYDINSRQKLIYKWIPYDYVNIELMTQSNDSNERDKQKIIIENWSIATWNS